MPESNLSEFRELSLRPNRRQPCRIADIASQLSGDESEALHAALKCEQGDISAGAIYKWLLKRNLADPADGGVVTKSVTNHRKGICRCYG